MRLAWIDRAAKRTRQIWPWRALGPARYSRKMAGNEYSRDARKPEPTVPERDVYRNKWVAVQDGHVVISATTHQELVRKVRAKGLKPGSFVARHVDVPPTEIVVGVG